MHTSRLHPPPFSLVPSPADSQIEQYLAFADLVAASALPLAADGLRGSLHIAVEQQLARRAAPSASLSPAPAFQPLLQFDAELIAAQMTYIDHDMFRGCVVSIYSHNMISS